MVYSVAQCINTAVDNRQERISQLVYDCLLCMSAAIMFAFQDNATVKKVVNALPRVGIGVKYGLPQTRFVNVFSVVCLSHVISLYLVTE